MPQPAIFRERRKPPVLSISQSRRPIDRALQPTQSYSLVINPPTLAITIISPLPAGAVGVAYSQKLPVVVSGGTPPYTWSVISGAVPGIDLRSREPDSQRHADRRPEPTTLTIQAADSANLTATRNRSA